MSGTGIGAGIFDQAWLQGVLGGLGMIVILSLVLERALSVFFEWGVWDVWLAKKNLRPPLALIASFVVCAAMKFDILVVLSKQSPPHFETFGLGTFLTAAIIAGGSKGAITLFQDVLGFAKGGDPEAVDKA